MFPSSRITGATRLAGAILFCSAALYSQTHEHGVAEIGIAIEGTTAQVEVTAPAGAIVGFEHEARTAADKTRQAGAFARFKSSVRTMFQFQEALGCDLRTLKVDTAGEHEHGDADHAHNTSDANDHVHDHNDVRALIDVRCKLPLKDTTLRFALKTVFPELQTLRVQVVGDDFQTGAELKGRRDSVKLGR